MAEEEQQQVEALPLGTAEFEVDGAGEWRANGIYRRCAELYNGCPQWEKPGTRWRVYWPCSRGGVGWVLGEDLEPHRAIHYGCEVDFEHGRALSRWTTEEEMVAWCERGNGHVVELYTERWLLYRTGLLPPMFEGGLGPAPELFPVQPRPGQRPRDATDFAREAAEERVAAELRAEGSLDLGPPMELLIPAAIVVGVCAIAFAAHWAGLVWDAMGLSGNARIEL